MARLLFIMRKSRCARCGIKFSTLGTITFHRFPKASPDNFEKAKKWAQWCYPDKDWSDYSSVYKLYSTNKTLCSQHFTKGSIFTSGIMVRNAVPCLDVLTNVEREQIPSHEQIKETVLNHDIALEGIRKPEYLFHEDKEGMGCNYGATKKVNSKPECLFHEEPEDVEFNHDAVHEVNSKPDYLFDEATEKLDFDYNAIEEIDIPEYNFDKEAEVVEFSHDAEREVKGESEYIFDKETEDMKFKNNATQEENRGPEYLFYEEANDTILHHHKAEKKDNVPQCNFDDQNIIFLDSVNMMPIKYARSGIPSYTDALTSNLETTLHNSFDSTTCGRCGIECSTDDLAIHHCPELKPNNNCRSIKCARCGVRRGKHNLSFHRFPKPNRYNFERLKKWAQWCYPDKDWSDFESINKLYTTNKVLCSRHFAKGSIFASGLLNRVAVPSLDVAEEFLKPDATEMGMEPGLNVKLLTIAEDHNYASMNVTKEIVKP